MTLRLPEGLRVTAFPEQGNTLMINDPKDLADENRGCRHMRAFLFSPAACSAMSATRIFDKRKRKPAIERIRAEAVPAVCTEIRMIFGSEGDFNTAKLERAVSLSIEKHCSVAAMPRSEACLIDDARSM